MKKASKQKKKQSSRNTGKLLMWGLVVFLAGIITWKTSTSQITSNSRASTTTSQISPITGDIAVTVIPITFTAYPKHTLYDSGSESIAAIKEDFLQLVPYLKEASFGKASLSSSSINVVNRVTLDHRITLSDPNNPYSCVIDGYSWNNNWSQLAQEALTKAGINPTSGQRIIFLAPGLACGPNSRSDAWLQPSTIYKGAWMQGFTTSPEFYDGVTPIRFSLNRKYLIPKGIIQALGFTLNLVWLSAEDKADPMGNTYLTTSLTLFNGAHANALGWIPAGDILNLNVGTSDASYRMKIYGWNGSVNDPSTGLPLPRLIKLSSNGYLYYIDYRAPNSYTGGDGKKKYGFDDGGGYMAPTNSVQGVEILTFEGNAVRVVSRLTANGQSFSDNTANVKITLQEFVDDYSNYWENEDKSVRLDIGQLIKSATPTKTPTPTPQPSQNQSYVRQSFLTTTGDKYYQRTCPFDTSTGGPSGSCSTSWSTISLGSGNGQGFIGAPVSKAGAIVNFLFPQNGTTKIRQSFLTTSGDQQFHRTCSFDPNQSDINSYSSGRSSNCTTWSGPYNVISINGQTAYGGYAAITFKDSSGTYKVRQSFLTTTGDKYYQRTCPFDTSTGGPSGSCSTSWSTISLGSGNGQGFIGAPVSKAGAIVNFLFPQNGATKIRQSFLTTAGNQQFHRTCSFDPNQSDINSYSSGKSSNCSAWSGPYNVISINGQTAYGGYAAITFTK